MSLLLALGGASGTSSQKPFPDEVFSAYLSTGNGTSLNVTTNVDLLTYGGAIYRKSRSAATDWAVYDTSRGITKDLALSTTLATSIAGQTTQTQGLTAISSSGHTWGSLAKVNTNLATYVDLVFRNASKFFYHTTKVHTNGVASTIDLSSLGTVGMVVIKSLVISDHWYTWHKDITAATNLKLNLSDTPYAASVWLSVSGTTLTISASAPSDTYTIHAWAHDSDSAGIIHCGTFNGDASGARLVTLPWEPQFLFVKRIDAIQDWKVQDIMRGFFISYGTSLYTNLSSAEGNDGWSFAPNATGFSYGTDSVSAVYLYLAIRRPTKSPTVGTQVYNAIARTGTGANATVTGVGFPVDLSITKKRSSTTLTGARFVDRLRGKTRHLDGSASTAEVTTADTVTGLDLMDGIYLGADATTSAFNTNTHTYIEHFIKRATGVFDQVCDTGTGVAHSIAHSLGVIPELVLRKGRSGATQFVIGSTLLLATEKINMPTNIGKVTDANAWNSTYPTASVFTVGTSSDVNTNTVTYMTLLFATLTGISKVGAYAGNGTSQTINCGFTTGARFVLIFRTDSSGEFYIWDTVRGIIAGNDPHISLNTTAAEVTTDDSIDPDASGFIVNQVAATNINVNLATYIYFSIS